MAHLQAADRPAQAATSYGASSERGRKLIDQLELELGELVAAASEDARQGGEGRRRAGPTHVAPFSPPASRRAAPSRAPAARARGRAGARRLLCCGSAGCRKLGEDITETLEVIPRSWKVIQTVREKFSCRACETVSQPPAPFHLTPRGWAGPSLLAMILFEKFGQHQPLNRQSERYAREGVAAERVDPRRLRRLTSRWRRRPSRRWSRR